MICGYFSLTRPTQRGVLELMPPMLHLKHAVGNGWLETMLERMVAESAAEQPGQQAVLSRMTEMLFVEVLRNWIKTLRPGEGGWLGAMVDPHIGTATSADSRITRAALDSPRTGAPRRARSVGLFDALYEPCRPADAPLPGCTTDGRGRVRARIEQRRHRPNCDTRRLRDVDGLFKGVPSTARSVSRPLPCAHAQ
jgi:hypothetical protein